MASLLSRRSLLAVTSLVPLPPGRHCSRAAPSRPHRTLPSARDVAASGAGRGRAGPRLDWAQTSTRSSFLVTSAPALALGSPVPTSLDRTTYLPPIPTSLDTTSPGYNLDTTTPATLGEEGFTNTASAEAVSTTETPTGGQPLGEPCGGFWYYHGPCAEGLTCQKTGSWTDTPGTCVRDEDYENNYDNYFDYHEWLQRPIGPNVPIGPQ